MDGVDEDSRLDDGLDNHVDGGLHNNATATTVAVDVGVNGGEASLTAGFSVNGINSGVNDDKDSSIVEDAEHDVIDAAYPGADHGAEPSAREIRGNGLSNPDPQGAEADWCSDSFTEIQIGDSMSVSTTANESLFVDRNTQESTSSTLCDAETNSDAEVWDTVATTTSGPHVPLFINENTSMLALLDTGSSFSIISENVIKENNIQVEIFETKQNLVARTWV